MDLTALASAYRQDLLSRGATASHAAKQARIVLAAGSDPAAHLEARSASWTAATLADARNRLAMFAVWLKAQPEGATDAGPWLNLPRPKAGRVALDRAVFEAGEVKRLLECQEIPAHRRTMYRCVAELGLRPVEVSRIQAAHVVREGGGFVLRLPGTSQKSGRPDPIHLDARMASEILENLPLVRVGLNHFEQVFLRDLMRAKIPQKQGKATRRLYGLRSFMISHLLRSGVDLLTVQKLARHKRVETTLLFYGRHRDELAGQERARAFSFLRRRA